MKNYRTHIFVISALFISHAAAAELALGVGAAGYLRPQKGLDAKGILIPLISYSGDRWSYQINTLSYRMVSFGDLQVNAVATARIQGYDEKDSPYLKNMGSRDSTIDGGVSLDWRGMNLTYIHDALNKHKGAEASISYGKGFDFNQLKMTVGTGLIWQGKELTNYYYGVKPAEASTLLIDGKTFTRDTYVTKDALIPKVNILVKYSMFDSWLLLGGAEINFLSATITKSPIVDSKVSWGVFMGVARSF